MRQYKLYFTLILFSLASSVVSTACKKFVQVAPPVTALTRNNVFESDATATAVLTGLYTTISSGSFATGVRSISLECGLSADEYRLFEGASNGNATYVQFYLNKLTNDQYLTFWENFYNYLLQINSAIDGLNNTHALTPSVKQQLLGEAKFMRAFIYFYLANLYGDVPLILTSNYTTNTNIPRTPKAQVWQQIILDLREAVGLLSTNYLDPTLLISINERVRPSKWAALAVLARSCLYSGNWAGADSAATAIINNTSLFNIDPLNATFLANSKEAIWQLQPVQEGWNTADGLMFNLPSSGPDGQGWPVSLDSSLMHSFEPGDQRRVNWVDSVIVGADTFYYPYKYKSATYGEPVTEYLMVLRLGEQYLIRAEAKANSSNMGDAVADLNIIRNRAGLPAYSGNMTQASVLNAIYHERRVELFSEWGHRWLDLKRNGIVNSVMGAPGNVCSVKGGAWNSNWQWYPIPLYDLQQDVSLIQNSGY